MTNLPTRWLGALLIPLLALPASAQAPKIPGWDLVWQDEFDADAVDTDEWEVLTRQDSFNNEKQYYVPAQASIVDGRLRITATDEPLANKSYRSARLESWDEWTHGRFEARIDLAPTQGMWPAFWLLPRSVAWPTGGEIDIMENRGSESEMTSSAYHWNTTPGTSNFVTEEYRATNPDGSPVDFHAGFHDYAVEWEKGVLRFYVDGNRYHTVTRDDAPVFDTPMSVILNLAVGGKFGGDPDDTTVFPQWIEVDYVRIWQRENGFVGLVNGGFDENQGSFNDWAAFGEAGGNLGVTDNALTGGHAALLKATETAPQYSGVYQNVAVEGGETLRARVDSFVPADDAFAEGNLLTLKVEFYREAGAEHGSAALVGEKALEIAGPATPTGVWRHNEFLVDAPADAVEARLTLILTKSAGAAGAAALDGVALTSVEFLAGDYNFDGRVDAADFAVWRETEGSTTNLAADGDRNGIVDEADRRVWEEARGAGASAAAKAVTRLR